MYPTLKNKNIVLIKKYNLKFNYNDIIVAKKDNKIIIKRLVGLPNDSVKIDEYLYINGNKYDNNYIENSGIASKEILLKDNEYFVLGDNRQASTDSRSEEIGVILKEEIVGKVILPNK